MADEHETESQAWAIEAAAAEAASRAAEELHRPPVVPMERVVDRTDIERGERAGHLTLITHGDVDVAGLQHAAQVRPVGSTRAQALECGFLVTKGL